MQACRLESHGGGTVIWLERNVSSKVMKSFGNYLVINAKKVFFLTGVGVESGAACWKRFVQHVRLDIKWQIPAIHIFPATQHALANTPQTQTLDSAFALTVCLWPLCPPHLLNVKLTSGRWLVSSYNAWTDLKSMTQHAKYTQKEMVEKDKLIILAIVRMQKQDMTYRRRRPSRREQRATFQIL